jgi:cell division protein FtsI (penicillin-binding protein 3)
MSGMVFKNIAEQTYLRKVQLDVEACRVDSALHKQPTVKNGNWNRNKSLLSSLNFSAKNPEEASDWVKMKYESTVYHPEAIALNNALVPDVRGMGARDAIYLLEQSGLRVNLMGAGKVMSQSLSPGQRLVKGSTIAITMK